MFVAGSTPPLHGVHCQYQSEFDTTHNDLPLGVQVLNGCVQLKSNATCVWSTQQKGDKHHTQVQIFSQPCEPDAFIVRVDCEGKGLFLLRGDTIIVDWDDSGTDAAHYFQSIAIALWLELRNVLCVHANALSFAGHTIALIGDSGMGKSTLSTYLSQRGYAWLTDDMLALHDLDGSATKVYPSWPQARLWPDSLEALTEQNSAALDKVHRRFAKRKMRFELDNRFAKGAALDVIYVLERREDNHPDCVLDVLSPSQALLTLIRHSMLADAYRPLQMEAKRYQQMAQVVRQVEVKRLQYPSGKQGLAQVQQILDNDFQSSLPKETIR